MFVARIDTDDGELHGWLQAGKIDLFVWFEGTALAQIQITVGPDVAEWQAPARLTTGRMRDSESMVKRTGLVDFDRRVRPECIETIRKAVDSSELSKDAAQLVETMLTDPKAVAQSPAAALIAALVRAAPRTTPQ